MAVDTKSWGYKCSVINKGAQTRPYNAAFRVLTMIVRIAAAALVAASLVAAPGIAAHAKAGSLTIAARTAPTAGR